MADKFWDEEKELLSIPKGRNNLKVKECVKNGNTFIDIREFYTDAAGEEKPDRKGIAIPADMIDKVIEAINSRK